MAQTPNLLITEIAANQNQKEVTANTAFVELEAALTNLAAITMTDADYTLSAGEGGQALGNMCFKFSATLTANRNIIVPTNKKLYAVQNATTGGHNLVVKTSGGTGVTIEPSSTSYAIVYCDGTNVVQVASSGGGSLASLSDVQITAPISGDALVYNGSKWVNGTVASRLSELSDVLLSYLQDGQALVYDSILGEWTNGTPKGVGSFSSTIGDGASTTITVEHDLGTLDVAVAVHDISTGAEEPTTTTYTVIDDNNISVTFGSAPASDSKRVVILASGSTGGGGGSVPAAVSLLPDWPPSVAGSLDDEFASGSSIDTGRWSWVNQGSATAAVAQSCVKLVHPAAGGSGTDWAMVFQTMPGTPWEVTAKLWVNPSTVGSTFLFAGLVLRDSGSGKLISFHVDNAGGLNGAHYTNPTTYAGTNAFSSITSSTYPFADITASRQGLVPYYLRIQDNGTSFVWQFSSNGIVWTTCGTEGRTAFLAAPDQVGIGCATQVASFANQITVDWFRRTA